MSGGRGSLIAGGELDWAAIETAKTNNSNMAELRVFVDPIADVIIASMITTRIVRPDANSINSLVSIGNPCAHGKGEVLLEF